MPTEELATILALRPDNDVRWTLPKPIADAVVRRFKTESDLGHKPSVDEIMALVPANYQSLIKRAVIPRSQEQKGLKATFVFVEEAKL